MRAEGLKLWVVLSKASVRTDPQLLEQILRNFLSNALKYTPKGSILIGCRRHGPELTIHISDTGIGITGSEMEAIFDPYRQGDNVSAFSSPGLGLGLSIVQRLAELMEHPIAVRSTPGKGSTFMITLPVAETAPEIMPSPLGAPFSPHASNQTGTILLVEDEEPLRDLLTEVLTTEGHTVIAKSNAPEAMAWASGDVALPDLLLTDFDLRGGINGLALAYDLPDVLGQPLPTIILSGDISTATSQSISASDYVQVVKPVMPEVLLAQISDLMLKARTEKARKTRKPKKSETTIHVIDDDPAILQTMRRLFEAEGWSVVTYSSAEEFLAAPRPEGTTCLLVDHLLPGMDGITLVAQLRAENSYLPAVMLTGHGDAPMAVAALKAGASDMIEKPASAAELLASVRQAMRNAEEGQARAQSLNAAQKRLSELTTREREVLARVLEGASNKIIAHELGINQRTVENHRAAVMRKTGARSLPALIRLALAAEANRV